MKEIKKVLMCILVMSIAGICTLSAQSRELPLDPKVRYGVLPNGMKYYIRANKKPEQRAEFYIVHNVGAILEEDNQNGLAHFTEHMAFNGTKNYPKKSMLSYLETIGCSFGGNVNAFTSIDVTCYNISDVPLVRENIIDSALLVLHDWSSFISFEQEELDAERGVIREEWRTRRTANFRMSDAIRPILYKDSKYAIRNVIGDTNVINNFTRDEIIDYYHKWYRPDLQAIIVVGDIDVKSIEAKIKTMFSDIPKVENPTPKPVYEVPDNKEPLIGIVSDPEATSSSIRVYYKHNTVDFDKRNTIDFYRELIIRNLVCTMFNQRLNEMAQDAKTPFSGAYVGYNEFTETRDAFTGTANAKPGQIKEALAALLTELRRADQHAFTETELERAKTNYLTGIERQYKERDKSTNDSFVWEYFSHFTSNYPTVGIEFEHSTINTVMNSITLDKINAAIQKYITPRNVVVTIQAAQNNDNPIPTKDEVLAMLNKSFIENTEAYKDNVIDKPLIANEPKAGKVVKESKGDFETTCWELSNGVKVVFKTTDFKEDYIGLHAMSFGGFSLIETKDLPSANLLGTVVSNMGVGPFSDVELNKYLTGKIVSIAPSIGQYSESINGSASPKDFETLLQLVYSYFTQPRFDQQAYESIMSRVEASLTNRQSNPNSAFADSITVTTYSHNPRVLLTNLDLLKKVDLASIQRIYGERFKNPADFTFFFIGNITPEQARPAVEKYLASLPTTKKTEKWKDQKIRVAKGKVNNNFSVPLQTPKTSVRITYSGDMEYTLENEIAMSAISHILDIRYTESIREEKGGTYGVGVGAGVNDLPIPYFYLIAQFDTDPNMTNELIPIVHAEIKTLADKGCSDIDLQKTKELFIKQYRQNLKENSYWASAIVNKYMYNYDEVSRYEEIVNALTPERIKEVVNKCIKQGNIMQVSMSPAE